MTTTLASAVGEYVGRCVEHLRDLPEDTRSEMLDDIRQIVHEVSAELEGRPDDLLGPPERFVSELRTAAGLGAGAAAAARSRPRFAAWLASVGRIRDRIDFRAVATWLRDLAADLRPAAWVVRGYAFGAAVCFWLSGVAHVGWLFDIVPVPYLHGSPRSGGLLTAALVVASVEIGRRRPRGWRRVAVIVLSVLSIVALGSTIDALRAHQGGAGDVVSIADVPVTTMLLDESMSGTVAPQEEEQPELAVLMDTAGQMIHVASMDAANDAWYALTDGSLLEPVVVHYRGYSAAVSSPDQLMVVLSSWGFDAD